MNNYEFEEIPTNNRKLVTRRSSTYRLEEITLHQLDLISLRTGFSKGGVIERLIDRASKDKDLSLFD